MGERGKVDVFPCFLGCPFIWLERVCLVIGFGKFWGMHLVSRLPCVVYIWIPFPLDEVLEHSQPAKMSMVDNTLHLIFFPSFKEVRWGPRIVGSMF
jgi:hypothetical protein